MTNFFVIYVAAFLLPLMFHSWRIAVLGLGVQGFVLGLILLATHDQSWMTFIEAINLFLFRALLVPWLLFRSMRRVEMAADFTLIKKSFSQWFFAFLIILIGSLFGRFMAPGNSLEAFQVGTATIAILTGFLILANQRHVIGQVVGIITFEGGLTLVELLSQHVMPLEVYIGISIVFMILLLTLVDFVNRFKNLPHAAHASEESLEDGIVL